MKFRTLGAACAIGALSLATVAAAPQSKDKKKGVPEVFHGKARVASGTTAGADALFSVQIDQYTPEADVKSMRQALQAGGSAGFVEALRKAPVAGQVKVGEQVFTVRWARKTATKSGYDISIVTEKPMYFVGGGLPGAKERAGYDVAVLLLQMDSSQVGEGKMAAAAKVKPGGATGVEIEDYASEPIKLVTVMKVIS